jgi:predicted AAA+ superfamily ATPase
MDYLRTKYLSKLEELKDKHYIKVITGIRRCGKSTLLKQFQNFLTNKYSINKKCIQMFNFNVLENAKLTYIEIYDLIIKKSIVGSINYIFLDEIQEIDKYEKILISLFENTEYKFDIYITGSNGKMLSSELATLITGRHKDIQIYPLNLNEYTEINNTLNIVKDNINFSYLRNGGLGTIIPNFGDDEFIENDMKTILFDTINNDVINRHKIRSSIMINKVIDYAYSNIGKQISALKLEKNLSIFNEFKITFKTIENYLQ